MIFGTVKSNLETIGKSANNVVDEYALAKKLALIVGSDFVCWVSQVILHKGELVCHYVCRLSVFKRKEYIPY